MRAFGSLVAALSLALTLAATASANVRDLGALLIILTSTPLALLNLAAGVFYTLAMPFTALVTSYVYERATSSSPNTYPTSYPRSSSSQRERRAMLTPRRMLVASPPCTPCWARTS